MEYLKIISKFRTRQISLHNKLHSLELLINTYANNYQNNNINKKSRLGNTNLIKNTMNKRLNSSNYDYISLYTNNNDLFKNKNNKKNSKINSTNNLNNFIPKPPKNNMNIQNKKNEIKKPYNNNKNIQSITNVTSNLRINTNINNYNNSTIIKNAHRQNNNYYTRTNNKNDNSNSIIIINNINNYYGKIENTINNNEKISEHIINENLRKKIKDKISKYYRINENEDEYLDSEMNDGEQKIIEEKEFKSNPNLDFRTKILKIKKMLLLKYLILLIIKIKFMLLFQKKVF